MTIVYGIIFALSLLLPIGYYLFVDKKKHDPWLFVLYVSVAIVNLGYLLLSGSKSVEFALAANKIAYFGQSFVPLCMFMIISGLCGYKFKKWMSGILVLVAMLMFSLVLTTGHLDWYYKSVELIYVDGAAKLVKEYGPLHPVNLIYVLGYFVAMIVVIATSIKKSKGKAQKLIGLMMAVVVGNIGMWAVEKLITWNFEFLSVSYLMSEFVFFFIYWMLQDYIRVDEISVNEKVGIDIATMPTETKINKVLFFIKDGEVLGSREREILEMILENKKRKEIASELNLSENTIKTHTRTLYSKLGVTSREELFALLVRK